ncbi:hypothetical protein BDD12DRAFT_886028 [Trichophaea hybrida]|nr:hypothetical protein BDD12DRAFT_886028 [Trichophaea hybrida]
MSYTLSLTFPQLSKFLLLFLRSHDLPTPNPVEIHAWLPKLLRKRFMLPPATMETAGDAASAAYISEPMFVG